MGAWAAGLGPLGPVGPEAPTDFTRPERATRAQEGAGLQFVFGMVLEQREKATKSTWGDQGSAHHRANDRPSADGTRTPGRPQTQPWSWGSRAPRDAGHALRPGLSSEACAVHSMRFPR
jgi:hypothetical protein